MAWTWPKSQKVVSSIPGGVIEFINWYIPSGRTNVPGILIDMSTMNISCGVKAAVTYRVIHKSLQDFRNRLRKNEDKHGRKEHINR